ncbi:hypothetical protein [Paraglaciecola sp. L3A3]|uniref:hypothetical protein n=1 Tax=Paraglaciecola sp. L3A3 TaxID=2686358 RepID=UPI00131C1598|nr:hypothetical protein [Paraglaciecola sp. L3A3]
MQQINSTTKPQNIKVSPLFVVFLLSLLALNTWAKEPSNYKVNVIDSSTPDYPAINRTIIIDANFIAEITQKQQLHLTETGLDDMQLQAQLFIDDIKYGAAVLEKNAKFEYKGVCQHPMTKLAKVIIYSSGDAVSVDTSSLISLQFNQNNQHIELMTVTDTPDEINTNYVKCEKEQIFTSESATFSPCSCDFK